MAVTVSISSVLYPVLEQTISVGLTSDGRSVATFNVKDLTGVLHFQPGQPVTIIDSTQGYTFFSYVNDSQEEPRPPTACIIHTINCVDGHYIPSKRYYAGPEYRNRYAGDIAADMVGRVLSGEGVVTSGIAVDNDQFQADWEQGTLTGTAAGVFDGGDLELAAAGTATIIAELGSVFSTGTPGNTQVITTPAFDPVNNPLMPVTPVSALGQNSYNAIKAVGIQNLNNAGNTYSYAFIAPGAGFTVSNHYFAFDMYVLKTSPSIQVSIDMVFTDGTRWRDSATAYDLQQNMAPHPNTDLSGLADNQWYHRTFSMAHFNGKVVSYYTIGFEGDTTGTYTAYFKNIHWSTDAAESNIVQQVYNNLTYIPLTGVAHSYGYTSTQTTIATCYSAYDFRWTPSSAISATGIVASNAVVWSAVTPGKSSVQIGYSLDGGASYIFCTNGKALPDFPVGLSLTGLSIQFIQFLVSDPASPETTPYLLQFEFQANPGYSGTKTDQVYRASDNTTWQAGTLSGTTNNGGSVLTLSGYTRNWDDGTNSNQDIYGNAGVLAYVQNKRQLVYQVTGTDARVRMTGAGQWQNFTMEVDVAVQANFAMGLVYRCTGWQNNNDTYAYSVTLTTTSLLWGKGTNSSSGGGAFTSLGTATVALTAGDTYRLKLAISNNSHALYVDNVLLISGTDATYTAAGYVGLRLYNNSGSAQSSFFDNFGIANYSMTGTWTSPVLSLNSLVSYVNSDVYYGNISGLLSVNDLTNTSITCSITTNGGGTWTPVNDLTNLIVTATGLPYFTAGQSLAGVNLQIQLTLATQTAVTLPGVNLLALKILGSFSANASRIAEPLDLNGVGVCASTLVSWNGIEPVNSLLQSVTNIFVDTSLDGSTWTQNIAPAQLLDLTTNSYGGFGSIAGIVEPDEPIIDDFTTDTSIDYISTFEISNVTTGSIGNWTWDTAHNRITTSSAVSSLLLYASPVTTPDVDISAILDTSTNGGFVWRYADQGNFYFLSIGDSSGGGPNTIGLFKVVSSTRTQIGSNAPISFTRGTPHAFRVTMIGTAITVTMDGVTIISTTDSGLSAAGFAGLRADSFGGSANQFYLLRVAFLGQNVNALTVYTRVRLTSTDPTLTPRVLDLSVSVRNANIQDGVLIPAANYSILNGNEMYISSILDDMATQSGRFYWKIEGNQFLFKAHDSTPAPFPITGNDVLIQNLKFDNINDSYRNDMWVTNGKDIIRIPEAFLGDAVTTSFNTTWPVDSINSITVNGQSQTFGVKGIDVGKQWYWTQGSNSIAQDVTGSANPIPTTGAIPLNGLQTLVIDFNGQTKIVVNITRDSEVARIAAIDKTSGIISAAINSSSHKGKGANRLDKGSCIQLGSNYLDAFAQQSTKCTFDTLRPGLAVGQLACIFSVMGRFAVGFLITDVKIDWKTSVVNGVSNTQPWYSCSAQSGAILHDWTRFVSDLSIM